MRICMFGFLFACLYLNTRIRTRHQNSLTQVKHGICHSCDRSLARHSVALSRDLDPVSWVCGSHGESSDTSRRRGGLVSSDAKLVSWPRERTEL